MRTFGNTTVGASWDWRSANVLVGRSILFTAGGILKDISAYLKEDRSGALNVKGVITDSTGHILTNGVSLPALISAEGWIKMEFSTSPTVVMGTTYILWVIPDSGVSNLAIAYNTDSVNNLGRVDITNNYASPTNPTDKASDQSIDFSIYAEVETWSKNVKNAASWNKRAKNATAWTKS